MVHTSRRRRYRPYRGSRRPNRAAIAALVFAVLILVGTGVWFLVLREKQASAPPAPDETQPGEALPSETPAESDPVPSAPSEEPSPTLPPEQDFVRGIYVSGPMAGNAYMDDLIALADETELNAMVIDIKNDDGYLTYQPAAGTAAADLGAYMPYIRDLPGLVARLKEHGIYTIARVVSFKDPVLAQARPGLVLRDQNGASIAESGSVSWVNPFEPEVWTYLEEVALGAAEAGFDEVQFDYVRFPAGGSSEIDFGPAGKGKEKKDAVAGFLTEVTALLHEKNVRCSADVFGAIITNPIDAEYVGQDFVQLAQIVDKICPMVYPSHYAPNAFGLAVPDSQPYETVNTALKYASSSLFGFENANCVRPWLQDFTATWVTGHIDYGPDELRAQFKAVYDAGYTDWLLWNAGNHYTAEGLEEVE